MYQGQCVLYFVLLALSYIGAGLYCRAPAEADYTMPQSPPSGRKSKAGHSPSSDVQLQNCPFLYDTNHSCCAVEEFIPFNSSFFFSLKLPSPHKYVCQAHLGTPMCLSTSALWEKKNPGVLCLEKGRDLAVPFKAHVLI